MNADWESRKLLSLLKLNACIHDIMVKGGGDDRNLD